MEGVTSFSFQSSCDSATLTLPFFLMPQECECMIRYTNQSNVGSGNRCSGLEENLNTVEALLATTLIDDRLQLQPLL